MNHPGKAPIKTLCFPVRGYPIQAVLLGYKKVRFGAGKYAGFGGGVKAGESLSAAAARELEEECGLCAAPQALEYRGRLEFEFPFQTGWSQTVHVFLARSWQGEPAESEEMRPEWFAAGALPFESMWPDNHHWLPHLLTGSPSDYLALRFVYAEDNATIDAILPEAMPSRDVPE